MFIAVDDDIWKGHIEIKRESRKNSTLETLIKKQNSKRKLQK